MKFSFLFFLSFFLTFDIGLTVCVYLSVCCHLLTPAIGPLAFPADSERPFPPISVSIDDICSCNIEIKTGTIYPLSLSLDGWHISPQFQYNLVHLSNLPSEPFASFISSSAVQQLFSLSLAFVFGFFLFNAIFFWICRLPSYLMDSIQWKSDRYVYRI